MLPLVVLLPPPMAPVHELVIAERMLRLLARVGSTRLSPELLGLRLMPPLPSLSVAVLSVLFDSFFLKKALPCAGLYFEMSKYLGWTR